MRLIAGFVLLPVVEIVLFIQIGGVIGVWGVLGLLLLSAVAGILLLKWTGTQAMAELRALLEQGANPAGPLLNRALMLAAGVLLVVPGFFSDFLALLLLLPPVRGVIGRGLQARTQAASFTVHAAARRQDGAPADVIDGEYSRVEPEDPQLPRH